LKNARRARIWPLALLIAAAAALGTCALTGWAGSELLGLLPALLLCCTLLLRRYPGARLLVARRRSPRPSSRTRAIVVPRRAWVRLAVRGSLLMGRSLAVRPPPAQLAAV
jgi:hypothetical protein